MVVCALFITALNYKNWLEPNWLSVSQSMIPSLLGFSLGTYALLFSLMSGRLKVALKSVKNPRGVPFLSEINAAFFHFIFVQVICLIWALLFEGSWLIDLTKIVEPIWPNIVTLFYYAKISGSFIGYFLLTYSILLIVASALYIYRLASITDPADG